VTEFVLNNCICTNVVDGDTIDVEIDVGLGASPCPSTNRILHFYLASKFNLILL